MNKQTELTITGEASTLAKSDVYQIVTDRIVELLERGVVPWHKPWTSDNRLPMNLVSGKSYRGINVFLLHAAGYGSPYWVTWKQAQDRGGKRRDGEKPSIAVFYKSYETKDKATGEKKFIPVLRYYRVWNVEQCEGFDYPKPEARALDFNPIAECERIVEAMPKRPEITHNEQRAYYRRSTDVVNMPKRETFDAESNYYATLFHELAHATGHESRIGRLQTEESRASGGYAREELIAEMSAAFLCGESGIVNRTLDNSAAYIAAWLERLKNDRKLIVKAASAAHKAADFILNRMAVG